MASKLQIWNMALSHIGDGDTVDDLDEFSIEAEECARHYPTVIDLLLERHAWSFAIKTVPLALHAEAATGIWSYRYALPNAYLRALQILPNHGTLLTTWIDPRAYLQYIECVKQPYDLELAPSSGERTIIANVQQALLRFIWRNETVSAYSSGFVLAASYLLASLLAGGPIIKSSKKAMEMLRAFELTVSQAIVDDSNSSTSAVKHVPQHLVRR